MTITDRLKYWQTLAKAHRKWLLVGVGLILAAVLTTVVVIKTQNYLSALHEANATLDQNLTIQDSVVTKLGQLTAKEKQAREAGLDTTDVVATIKLARHLLFIDQKYDQASTLISQAITMLDTRLAEKAEQDRLSQAKGILSGTVRTGTAVLEGVKISVKAGDQVMAEANSGSTGTYMLTVAEGSYTVVAAKSGYATYSKTRVSIVGQQTTTLDLSLTKATPAPAAVTTSGDTTANSSYSLTTVNTSRGSFTVNVMTFNLASGQIRVVTDTANDNDCTDNCPVKSLKGYLDSDGGFAAINGTYFCPADYASCAGKVNSFDWKIYNSRLQKMINATNGSREQDPFMTFSASGAPHYFSSWKAGSTSSMYAGINSWPALVSGGTVTLNESVLDDKQKTVKGNRGALGLRGSTMYAVIARSATVPDLAAVMQSLGVDSAMNIDGGGSSAMIYKGAYKVGPGRNLPNAVIFVGG
jgi:hypothetical protein